MSKTRGNAMDYRPAAALYGPDALRYYLLREVAFGQDGGVGYAGHARPLPRRARERARQPRLAQHRDGRRATAAGSIPAVAPAPELAALSAEVAAAYDHRFDLLDFTGALEHVWELVRALNRFVEARAPWELAKSDDPRGRGRARRDAGDAVRGRARARGPAVAVPALPGARSCSRRSARRATTSASTGPCSATAAAGRSTRRAGRCSRASTRLRRDRHPRAPAGSRGRRGRGDRGGRRGGRRAHRLRRRLAGARRGGDRPGARARRGLRDGRAAPAPRRARGTTPCAPASIALLDDPSVVAVGECGLDYFRERASRGAQAAAFAGQVVLAEQHRQAARDPHARGGRRHARRAAERPHRRRSCTASRCPSTSTRSSSAAGTCRSRAT